MVNKIERMVNSDKYGLDLECNLSRESRQAFCAESISDANALPQAIFSMLWQFIFCQSKRRFSHPQVQLLNENDRMEDLFATFYF